MINNENIDYKINNKNFESNMNKLKRKLFVLEIENNDFIKKKLKLENFIFLNTIQNKNHCNNDNFNE
jgi:hypothetical protein